MVCCSAMSCVPHLVRGKVQVRVRVRVRVGLGLGLGSGLGFEHRAPLVQGLVLLGVARLLVEEQQLLELVDVPVDLPVEDERDQQRLDLQMHGDAWRCMGLQAGHAGLQARYMGLQALSHGVAAAAGGAASEAAARGVCL